MLVGVEWGKWVVVVVVVVGCGCGGGSREGICIGSVIDDDIVVLVVVLVVVVVVQVGSGDGSVIGGGRLKRVERGIGIESGCRRSGSVGTNGFASGQRVERESEVRTRGCGRSAWADMTTTKRTVKRGKKGASFGSGEKSRWR